MIFPNIRGINFLSKWKISFSLNSCFSNLYGYVMITILLLSCAHDNVVSYKSKSRHTNLYGNWFGFQYNKKKKPKKKLNCFSICGLILCMHNKKWKKQKKNLFLWKNSWLMLLIINIDKINRNTVTKNIANSYWSYSHLSVISTNLHNMQVHVQIIVLLFKCTQNTFDCIDDNLISMLFDINFGISTRINKKKSFYCVVLWFDVMHA